MERSADTWKAVESLIPKPSKRWKIKRKWTILHICEFRVSRKQRGYRVKLAGNGGAGTEICCKFCCITLALYKLRGLNKLICVNRGERCEKLETERAPRDGMLNARNKIPYKTEVQTSSFCIVDSVSIGIDAERVNPYRALWRG